MSKILCFLAFILWSIVLLLLAISILGLLAFIVIGDDAYFTLGKDLVKGIKGGEQ
jgi:type IV secretory pathway TrbL component